MEIRFHNVTCGYEHKEILKNLNMSFKTGDFCCILGANGIGKTTLFKTLLGFIDIKDGEIYVGDMNLRSMHPKQLARYISYVPQAKSFSYQFSVLDIILMGRAPYIKRYEVPSESDVNLAIHVMKQMGIEDLKDKMYFELSGGEQQVVLISRALIQETKFIVMDEPASNLDFENQKKVLDVLKQLAKRDIGIIMSTHAPDHAIYCGTKVVLIRKDKSVLEGEAEKLLTPDNLYDVYGVDIDVMTRVAEDGTIFKSCRLV